MKVIGYVRVSTKDQAKEGVSLEAQQARIKAYCIAKGWELLQNAGGEWTATTVRRFC